MIRFRTWGVILLMEEILHQLRLVVYPIIYRVLYISGGCVGFQPSTVVWLKKRSVHLGCIIFFFTL